MDVNKHKQRKLLIACAHLLPFLAMYIVSVVTLSELYLFKWLLDRWYLFVWVIAAILAFKQKYFIATSLTIGSVLGIPLGQFCGDFLRNRNIQSITALMSPDEQAQMHLHYGVPIWLGIVLLSIIVGILLETLHKKKKHN